METIYLAGGCFWCTEAVFRSLHGVLSVTPGYMGGHSPTDGRAPTYEEVCSGMTGHAEVVKVEYDPEHISTEAILDVFFDSHDPTTLDRQGADVGNQYRSAIFYTEHEQKDVIDEKIREYGVLVADAQAGKAIVTEVSLADEFYPAEDYHHDYFGKNPDKAYCQLVVAPKIKKLEKNHKELLK